MIYVSPDAKISDLISIFIKTRTDSEAIVAQSWAIAGYDLEVQIGMLGGDEL